MAANTWAVAYNGSDGPQPIDEEGHSIDPGTFACVRRSLVQDLLNDEILIIVDPDTIGDGSDAGAKTAKDEAASLNAEIDAAKAASEQKAGTRKPSQK